MLFAFTSLLLIMARKAAPALLLLKLHKHFEDFIGHPGKLRFNPTILPDLVEPQDIGTTV
jgi:hypothetical protein